MFALCRALFALDETGTALAGKLAASLFSAIAGALLFLAVGRRQPERDAFWAAAVFVLGTSVWSTSQSLWQHPLAVLWLCLALLWLVKAEHDDAWAARAGSWVIEDDYVSEFRYEGHPLEALQSLDRDGRVIYVGTFSKTLFPALRVGYLVLPRSLVSSFIAAKWAADRFSAMLAQEALADFITTGQFERYLRRAGNRNAAKRRALIGALRQHFGDRVEIAGENTGVHLVVWLNDVRPRDLAAVIARARAAGAGLYSVAPFYTSPPPRAGLLFGYASLTEAEIRAGIRRMTEVM